MLWAGYFFFGLFLAIGVAGFVLLRRAKEPRAWCWFLIALVGVAGVVGVMAGHADGEWRRVAGGAMFGLFGADHFLQYLQSRRRGAPKNAQLGLAAAWLVLGAFQTIDFV